MTPGDPNQFVNGTTASIPWVREGTPDAASSGAPRSLVESNTVARPRLYDDESDVIDFGHRRRESPPLNHQPHNDAARDPNTEYGTDGGGTDSHGADIDHGRDATVRRAILDDDRRDRALERQGRRRGTNHGIADRPTGPGRDRGRRAASRTGFVDVPGYGGRIGGAVLRWTVRNRRRPGNRHEFLGVRPTADELLASAGDVATRRDTVRRFAAGPLHGIALATYCLLVPYVVVAKWAVAAQRADGTTVRLLLVALSLLWIGFVVQLARNIGRHRRGVVVVASGSTWLAGLIVTILALAPSPGYQRPPVVPAAVAIVHGSHHARRETIPDDATIGTLPFALIAKRRLDRLRDGQNDLGDDEVDDVIGQLRAADPDAVCNLRRLIADRLDGVVRVGSDFAYGAPVVDESPAVACVVDGNRDEPIVAFAHEGGRLRLPANWTDQQVVNALVGLHDGGRVVATNVEYDLLHSLAIRSVRRHVVVYLGDAADLDDALRASAVTIDRSGSTVADGDHNVARSPGDDADAERTTVVAGVYVELLRPDPIVLGLSEPFIATLRRRGVEMVAYLAVHRGEPVSGDRLRTRVLVHADVDASLRTLANTASTVRRSLGVDEHGPRLHPVATDGLYRTHGISSDVERFHALVRDARRCPAASAAPLLLAALQLVRGEPLAGVRHGFEWFTVEGHLSRLQRDGEWAALALHDLALEADDVERAYWAIERGRCLDPFSDALTDALVHVPRLRQFRRDRASTP